MNYLTSKNSFWTKNKGSKLIMKRAERHKRLGESHVYVDRSSSFTLSRAKWITSVLQVGGMSWVFLWTPSTLEREGFYTWVFVSLRVQHVYLSLPPEIIWVRGEGREHLSLIFLMCLLCFYHLTMSFCLWNEYLLTMISSFLSTWSRNCCSLNQVWLQVSRFSNVQFVRDIAYFYYYWYLEYGSLAVV